MRWASWMAVMAVILVASVTAADAADRCRALQAELASLGRSTGSAKAERYRVSAERQRTALKATERQYRRLGCGGASSGRAECRTYADTIARMKANLASLESMSGGGSGAAKARRTEIRAQMKAAGCREPVRAAAVERKPPPAKARTAPKPKAQKKPALAAVTAPKGGIAPLDLGGAGGLVPVSRDPEPTNPPFDRTLLDRFTSASSYRTICVRTCDGYYFPISWSARPGDFEKDVAMCRAMCPGADAELYVHPTGTESDDATTLGGASYRDLPAAYRYRTVRDPACGCEAGTRAVTDLAPAAAPLPTARPELPAAATEPPEDWEIPDGDSSTVPKPEEAAATTLVPTLVTFETRRFPGSGAVPVENAGPVRRVGPAWPLAR